MDMSAIEELRKDLATFMANVNQRLALIEAGGGEPPSPRPPVDQGGPFDRRRPIELADALRTQPPSLHVMANDAGRYESESWLDASWNQKIVWVQRPSPKRAGFKSVLRYDFLYQEGLTLREYAERHAEEVRKLGGNAKRAIECAKADLRWDHKHRFIKLGN
jgi:hypothetical protein